jgi:DHA1 family bicyclomycin/chloramphenicol resistance-like MFS transporter
MSKALSGLGVIALSSPLVGGLLAAAYGWRSALLGCGLFGAATLALVARRLPETARALNPRALQPLPMLRQWLRIARHPTFVAWAALVAATDGGLFAFLAGSSFVFIDVLGSSRLACGLYIACCSGAYIGGTFWCRHWLLRHGLAGAVKRGAWFTLAGGGSMVALAWAGVIGPWAIVLPQMVFSFGHGIHQPCGQAAVIGPFPQQAGAASALAGFILAAAAVFVGAWLGVAMDGTVFPLVLTIGAMAAATTTVAWTLVQRHGEAR